MIRFWSMRPNLMQASDRPFYTSGSETHVHVRSLRHTRVATYVSRSQSTCTCVSADASDTLSSVGQIIWPPTIQPTGRA